MSMGSSAFASTAGRRCALSTTRAALPLRAASGCARPLRASAVRAFDAAQSPSSGTTSTSSAAPAPASPVDHAKFYFDQLPSFAAELERATPSLAAAVPLIVLGVFLLGVSPAEAAPQHQYDLSEELDLWSNVVRYGRFFVTVMLGTVTSFARPFAGLFKNPLTGTLSVVGLVAFVYGLKVTLELMLGLSDFQSMTGSVPGSEWL